ncbi:hypothetical protein BDZ94DRAFT_1230369 [Collybia nuda]|uniref:F-box domain-containing protein n=1 Tax=Collybia nuda TaxID=64659 RepID=A0A9P6CCC3_9AGAR|nr:hypothetical protein BDZ94DRAFT_1230369 [Collybia nuda]
MFDLPTELALVVLAYLPLDSVQRLRLVCQSWHKFILLQENTIYHQAAMFHKLIPQSITSVEEAHVLYSKHSLDGVGGWRDLCERRYIERSWSGKAASNLIPYNAAGTSVHRIKVDEMAGYILTTSCEGGLTVVDTETDQILWSLSKVRRHAHCEYGEGYVIFDFSDGAKEVWRRTDDYDLSQAEQRVPSSLPSSRQVQASDVSAALFPGPSTRGHFRPWGLLYPPQPTRAFRFVYPILGAAAWDHVFLWDVRTGALVQTIENTQCGSDGNLQFLGDINYIEVGQKHVFLCGVHGLRGFSRETGRCILDRSSSDGPFGAWDFSISPNPPTHTTPGSVFVRQDTVRHPTIHPQREIIDEFVAGM